MADMLTPAESRMYQDGQQNAGGMRRTDDNGKPYFDQAPLTEYPRMLYRKTDKPVTQEYADAAGLKDEPMVINSYDGLLCETRVANSLDEAEILSSEGWDVTPRAAHGLSEGIAAQTSAKDDEIAALKAELARVNSEPKRGPGRPPKPVDDGG